MPTPVPVMAPPASPSRRGRLHARRSPSGATPPDPPPPCPATMGRGEPPRRPRQQICTLRDATPTPNLLARTPPQRRFPTHGFGIVSALRNAFKKGRANAPAMPGARRKKMVEKCSKLDSDGWAAGKEYGNVVNTSSEIAPKRICWGGISGRWPSNSAECGPNVAKLGPIRGNVGPKSGQLRPTSTRFNPGSTESGPRSNDLDKDLPGIDQTCSELSGCGPS